MEQTSTTDTENIVSVEQEVSQESPVVEVVTPDISTDSSVEDFSDELEKALEAENVQPDRTVEVGRDYSQEEGGQVMLITQHMIDDANSVKEEFENFLDGNGGDFKTFPILLKHNPSKADVIAKFYGYNNKYELMAEMEEIKNMPPENAKNYVYNMFQEEQIEEVKGPSIDPVATKTAVIKYCKQNGIPDKILNGSKDFATEYLELIKLGMSPDRAVAKAVKISGIKYTKPEEVVAPVNVAASPVQINASDDEFRKSIEAMAKEIRARINVNN